MSCRSELHRGSFSPYGRTIALCYYDSTVRLWNLDDKKRIILKGHKIQPYSVGLSPDSKIIASIDLSANYRCPSLSGFDASLPNRDWVSLSTVK
ncbi:WD40 repeat domain-containing protein [Funiculus sociatus]|uniref:WD40 repeat domain-containing protein n=1 Tax=Funiculus sociatus TaxID=450527 RepID=UPI003D648753